MIFARSVARVGPTPHHVRLYRWPIPLAGPNGFGPVPRHPTRGPALGAHAFDGNVYQPLTVGDPPTV